MINGKAIQDLAQYISTGLNLSQLPYRKIHNGEDHFSESIVPSLNGHEFVEFDRLFTVLQAQIDFSMLIKIRFRQ